jgi:hypothetical protein
MNDLAHKKITEISLDAAKTFSDEDTKTIVEASILPDVDENQSGFVHHFYNPVTGTNYLGSEDSAKARCIAHFGKFMMSGSNEELGRSIHFLEDICTPVHAQYEDASDAVLRGKLHIEFEKKLDRYVSDMPKKFNENYPDLSPWRFSTITDLITYCALESAKNYYLYRDQNEKQQAIKNTAELAFLAVNSLLSFKPLSPEDMSPEDKAKEIKSKFIEFKDKAEEIKNKSGKTIGVLIEHSVLHCTAKLNYRLSDIAPLCDSYRLRLGENCEVLAFKKAHIGSNYVLDEIIKI